MTVYTIGCDKCEFYVEFTEMEKALWFFENTLENDPFYCGDKKGHKLSIVTRRKDLDFRE